MTGIEFAYDELRAAGALRLYIGTMTEEEAHTQTMERLYKDLKRFEKEKLKQLGKEEGN